MFSWDVLCPGSVGADPYAEVITLLHGFALSATRYLLFYVACAP